MQMIRKCWLIFGVVLTLCLSACGQEQSADTTPGNILTTVEETTVEETTEETTMAETTAEETNGEETVPVHLGIDVWPNLKELYVYPFTDAELQEAFDVANAYITDTLAQAPGTLTYEVTGMAFDPAETAHYVLSKYSARHGSEDPSPEELYANTIAITCFVTSSYNHKETFYPDRLNGLMHMELNRESPDSSWIIENGNLGYYSTAHPDSIWVMSPEEIAHCYPEIEGIIAAYNDQRDGDCKFFIRDPETGEILYGYGYGTAYVKDPETGENILLCGG